MKILDSACHTPRGLGEFAQLAPARSSSQKLAERGEAGSGAESLAAGYAQEDCTGLLGL
jgi:hypothetical protein